jgi:nucleoside-triphosphatase THEP1
MTGSVTTGYDLVNIETGERKPFLRQDEKCGTEMIGKFCISPPGIDFGNKVIGSLSVPGYSVAVIDEVGMLEIGGKGWAESLDRLLGEGYPDLVISVRDSNIEKVKTRWDLICAIVINIGKTSHQDAVNTILSNIRS